MAPVIARAARPYQDGFSFVEEKIGEQNFRVLTLALGAGAGKNNSVGYVELVFGCHR